MNQDFELGFDSIDHNGAGSDKTSNENATEYRTLPSTRNVCFVWPDGRKKFLNYAYMVSAEFKPEDSTIVLEFTSQAITLKGIKLQALFEKLLFHLPMRIVCEDQRYNQLQQAPYTVNEII